MRYRTLGCNGALIVIAGCRTPQRPAAGPPWSSPPLSPASTALIARAPSKPAGPRPTSTPGETIGARARDDLPAASILRYNHRQADELRPGPPLIVDAPGAATISVARGRPTPPHRLLDTFYERKIHVLSAAQLYGAIMLMHCGSTPAAEALPAILDRCAAMGLELTTVSEVLGR